MSVINNVLKDLESKPSAFAPLDVAGLSVEGRQKNKPLTLWMAGFFLMMVAAFIGYSIYRDSLLIPAMKTMADPHSFIEKKTTNDTAEAIAIESSALRPGAEIKLPEVVGNEISGLQIRETSKYMELEFQFSNKVQSFLKQQSINRYIFQIKDSINNIDTPLLGQNPWLKKMALRSAQNGVEIQFDTQQGVLVETRAINNEDSYYWLIRLNKPASKPVKKVDNTVKPSLHVTEIKPVIGQAPNPVTAKQTENQQLQKQPLQIEKTRLDIKPVIATLTNVEKLNNAVAATVAGKWIQAEQGFEKLIGSSEDKKARVHLIKLLQKQQKISERKQLLSQSLKHYPDDMYFMLLEANRLFSAKQYNMLIQQYRHQQQNKDMLSLLSASYQRTDQHGSAIEHYIKVIKIDPKQPKYWISLAISQQHEGQVSQALHSYQMADRSGKLNDRLKGFVQQRIRQLSQ